MNDDVFEKKVDQLVSGMTWGKAFKWFVISCVALMVMGLISGAIGTFGKVVSAPSRVINKTLETNNIIQSYEWFYDINAAYIAKANQVTQYKEFYASESNSSEKTKLRTEMAAMQQVCRNLTEKYNANGQKINKSIFKGWSLPDTLSIQTCN